MQSNPRTETALIWYITFVQNVPEKFLSVGTPVQSEFAWNRERIEKKQQVFEMVTGD
jgi:hypothetical protein